MNYQKILQKLFLFTFFFQLVKTFVSFHANNTGECSLSCKDPLQSCRAEKSPQCGWMDPVVIQRCPEERNCAKEKELTQDIWPKQITIRHCDLPKLNKCFLPARQCNGLPIEVRNCPPCRHTNRYKDFDFDEMNHLHDKTVQIRKNISARVKFFEMTNPREVVNFEDSEHFIRVFRHTLHELTWDQLDNFYSFGRRIGGFENSASGSQYRLFELSVA